MKSSEMWMKIPSAEGRYSIDVNSGKIMSHFYDKRGVLRNRILNGSVTKRGYRQVRLNGKFRYVHDLVAETVFEKPAGLKWTAKHCRSIQVDHIDNDKLNNSWQNLQWLTMRDNLAKWRGGKWSKIPVPCRKEFLEKMGEVQKEGAA